jgi:hypothetical protein
MINTWLYLHPSVTDAILHSICYQKQINKPQLICGCVVQVKVVLVDFLSYSRRMLG